MNISEKCRCGASFAVRYADDEAVATWRAWRDEHAGHVNPPPEYVPCTLPHYPYYYQPPYQITWTS